MKYLLIFSVLISINCLSQPSKGAQFRKEGKLEAAIEAYKTDFKKTPEDWRNTYNLACAYALTFQKDSSFHYLSIALKDDKSLWALADSDLFGLIEDSRWATIAEEQILRNEKENGKLEQPDYAKKLLSLIIKDQALDYYIDQAKSYFVEHGNAPQWYYPLGAYKEQIGKKNYTVMQGLIEEYGWPKYSTVGNLAADAPLLVINHHKSDLVRKMYLPQLKQSCLEKEGSCMEYAKIQDRILISENKPQRYGMQFRYTADRKLEPFPIENPEYVDQRRSAIGLVPLKTYLKRKIDYNWNVEQKHR